MSPNSPVALELLDGTSRDRDTSAVRKVLQFGKRLVREQPLGALGGVICLLFLFAGVFASVLAPYGYDQIDPVNRLHPPSWAVPLGTDNLGRDMLSRVLYGARLSVIIALSSAALATVISTVIGIVSGYMGGATDMIIQRFVDAWMSFPDLIVLIVMVSVFGPGMVNIVVTLLILTPLIGARMVMG